MACFFSTLISPAKNTSVDFNRYAYLDQSQSLYMLVITRERLQEIQKESIALKFPTLFLPKSSCQISSHGTQKKNTKCTLDYFLKNNLQILYLFLIADHVLILTCHIIGQTCLLLLNAAFRCQICPERDHDLGKYNKFTTLLFIFQFCSSFLREVWKR